MARKASKNNPRKAYTSFPSKDKNLANIKLLLSDPDFNKRIREIRDYLGIPPEGFVTETDLDSERYQKWNAEMEEKSDDMMKSPEFNIKLRAIREKVVNKEISQYDARELSRELHDKIPLNYLNHQPRYLTDEFNVPINYAESIKYYIVSSKVIFAPLNPYIETRDLTEERHERSVTIKFFAKLTDRDLKQLKYYVNNIAGRNLPDFQPLKNIDTKIAMESYHKNKHVLNEGDNISYTLSAKEIAKNVKLDTGKKVRAEDVYESVRELQEHRQKRFKKNLGKDTL